MRSTAQTLIVLHRPEHRRRTLSLQPTDRAQAERAYDRHVGDYLDFLRSSAQHAGFRLTSDERDWDTLFTIDETDHTDKQAAHAWLQTQPDFWTWLPRAD